MIEDFSAGYYSVQVETYTLKSGPALDRTTYDYIREELYDDSNAPLIVSFSVNASQFIEPHGQAAMPARSIGLPQSMWHSLGRDPEDGPMTLFILKPDYAYLFTHY